MNEKHKKISGWTFLHWLVEQGIVTKDVASVTIYADCNGAVNITAETFGDSRLMQSQGRLHALKETFDDLDAKRQSLETELDELEELEVGELECIPEQPVTVNITINNPTTTTIAEGEDGRSIRVPGAPDKWEHTVVDA